MSKVFRVTRRLPLQRQTLYSLHHVLQAGYAYKKKYVPIQIFCYKLLAFDFYWLYTIRTKSVSIKSRKIGLLAWKFNTHLIRFAKEMQRLFKVRHGIRYLRTNFVYRCRSIMAYSTTFPYSFNIDKILKHKPNTS